MSITIVKAAIIGRLKETPGIVYQGDSVPVVDPASTDAGNLPDLHITNPIVNANFVNHKGSFDYNGTADIVVYALTTQYGDGVTLDVCELIRQCLSDWKPPEVTTFLPVEVTELPPLEKYRSASIRFDWIT